MKFSCDRELLLGAAELVSQVVPAKDIKPVLRNLKIKAAGDGAVELAASDLEIGVVLAVRGVQMEDAGAMLVPANLLVNILREGTSKDVSVGHDNDGNVIVTTGSAEFELASEDPDNFPDIPRFTGSQSGSMSADLLCKAIGRVAYAAAKDSVRYAMNGVLLEMAKEQFRLVATDGRRMSIEEQPARGCDAKAIIPTKAMRILERLLNGRDGEVGVQTTATEVIFQAGNTWLYSRLLEGRFPNYKEVLPKINNAVATTFAAGELLRAVRQAAITAPVDSRRLTITSDAVKLTLTARGAGKAKVDIAIPSTGKFTIALDHQRLQEFLGSLDSAASVTLYINGADKPAMFCWEKLRHVAMPLN